jgi:hypothetical protein
LTGILCRKLEIERREMERCEIRDTDMGIKKGNNEDREEMHKKIDEKQEEDDSDSDTISISSDFFAAEDIEVEILWQYGERDSL